MHHIIDATLPLPLHEKYCLETKNQPRQKLIPIISATNCFVQFILLMLANAITKRKLFSPLQEWSNKVLWKNTNHLTKSNKNIKYIF